METIILFLLMPLPYVAGHVQDPAPGLWQTREDARNLECARMSQQRAHELYPGRIPAPPPRGNLANVDALTCSRRMVGYGQRPARDEVILTTLGKRSQAIADAATAAVPGQDVTWHVDAFYPDLRMAQKIAVAARVSLAEDGHRVSDRVPLLAAGDLAVLSDLPLQKAYPLACRRYRAEGTLGAGEAFLAIVLADPRETVLHAGVCQDGVWRWLR